MPHYLAGFDFLFSHQSKSKTNLVHLLDVTSLVVLTYAMAAAVIPPVGLSPGVVKCAIRELGSTSPIGLREVPLIC